MKFTVMMFSILLVFSITKSQPPSLEKALLITSIIVAGVMYLCYCFICDEKKTVNDISEDSKSLIGYPFLNSTNVESKINKLEKEANVALILMVLALMSGAAVVYF